MVSPLRVRLIWHNLIEPTYLGWYSAIFRIYNIRIWQIFYDTKNFLENNFKAEKCLTTSRSMWFWSSKPIDTRRRMLGLNVKKYCNRILGTCIRYCIYLYTHILYIYSCGLTIVKFQIDLKLQIKLKL